MLFEQVYIRLCASFLLVIGTCKVNILARCESPILMKFGTNVVFEKKKKKLTRISFFIEIIEDTVFV